MESLKTPIVVVIPAAGVGKRMQANCPKQYLTINNKTILEHTVERLLSHPLVKLVIIALGESDAYFPNTSLYQQENIKTVVGGKERVDSVLAGLKTIDNTTFPWVLVHDAARPCITHQDITKLIDTCLSNNQGGLLACPVRDTMKLAHHQLVDKTIDRNNLWHAYTPQMYKTSELLGAIEHGIAHQLEITDESSAVEFSGIPSQLIEGRSDNIKITRSDDLAFAEFILSQQALHTNTSSHYQQEISCE